jgi:hypothetical protein
MPNSKFTDKLNEFHGVFVGQVEYNRDPENWGRCQVRVVEVNGTEEETASKLLPWAYVATSTLGGFYDGGSHMIPPVGATVLVIFEQGKKNRPWIIGGAVKQVTHDTSDWKYGEKNTPMGVWKPEDPRPDMISPEDPKLTTDAPKENRYEFVPGQVEDQYLYTVLKTPKGATLIINDRDEKEYVRLIDRSGQVMEMISPVDESSNTANASQRGILNKADSDGLPYNKIVDETAKIRFIDLAGQQLVLGAKKDAESVLVRSQARTGARTNTIEVDSSKDKDYVKVMDYAGQHLLISAEPNKEKILIKSQSKPIPPVVAFPSWNGNATIGSIQSLWKAVPEVWTVTILPTPTLTTIPPSFRTYSVTGSASGLQSKTGVMGMVFESDDPKIAFKVIPGTTPNLPGDTATITTTGNDGVRFQTIEIDTTQGAEFIKLTDKDGQIIHLDAANKKLNISCHGDTNFTTDKTYTDLVKGNLSAQVLQSRTLDVLNTDALTVGATKQDQIGGNWIINCGGSVTINASGGISLNSMSPASMNVSGGMNVLASGAVSISAPSINLN